MQSSKHFALSGIALFCVTCLLSLESLILVSEAKCPQGCQQKCQLNTFYAFCMDGKPGSSEQWAKKIWTDLYCTAGTQVGAKPKQNVTFNFCDKVDDPNNIGCSCVVGGGNFMAFATQAGLNPIPSDEDVFVQCQNPEG